MRARECPEMSVKALCLRLDEPLHRQLTAEAKRSVTLSTSGLRALDLPREVRDVIVLADGDDPGEAAAQESAWRWKRKGRRVRIARPPRGMDFNDLLVRHAPRIEEPAR